jgi:bis(5'-nucleosyl)-tetraphosphatase (symmetrical)
MTVYAIGDVQGCHDDLRRLLERVRFDAAVDRLWFVGDLVNRGPDSLSVLRFIRDLGDRATAVLGNHDLHLLAVAAGIDKVKGGDTFDAVLSAPDRDELLGWLRHRPLLHVDSNLGFALLHAGLPPQWSLAEAGACAGEVESVLRGPNFAEFFQNMYGDLPDRWDESLRGWDRLRFIVNCFTRLRYVDDAGRILLKAKGAPEANRHLTPWFRAGTRKSGSQRIVFGHWSTLGLVMEHNVYALDTGCVWGGALTALRLDATPVPIAIDCAGACKPRLD